jgi:predicted RNA-binding Zn ribbon-like protein
MAQASTQWLGDQESKPAPGALRQIQALINTLVRETGDDRLADPADAAPWLIANNFLEPGAGLTSDDLRMVVDVREALRAMTIHNTGGPAPTPEALAPLRRIASAGRAQAQLSEDGVVSLGAAGTSVPDRLLDLLLVVKDAQLDGSWELLKACASEECQWAFYDRSRNHGGTWCVMSSCGNKMKNRDFRARKRAR